MKQLFGDATAATTNMTIPIAVKSVEDKMVKNVVVPDVSDAEQMSKNGTLEQEESTKQNGEPLESDVAINSEGPGEL